MIPVSRPFSSSYPVATHSNRTVAHNLGWLESELCGQPRVFPLPCLANRPRLAFGQRLRYKEGEDAGRAQADAGNDVGRQH